MTAAQRSTTRSISLYTLLGSAILIAFSIVIAANLWGQYRLTNQLINKEITNSVRQNHALIQSVLNGQLKLLGSQLQMLSQQEELTSLDPDSQLHQIEVPLKALIGRQKQANSNDFIMLGSPDGQLCRNSYQIFITEALNCNALIAQFDSNLYNWHLAKLEATDSPILTTLTRTPIVAQNGKVLAYLYGGIVLTGNFSVINQVISTAAKQTSAVGIAYRDQIIATSAPKDSTEFDALQQAISTPDRLMHTLKENLYSMSHRVQLENSQNYDVRLISVIRTDGRTELQQGMIQQTSGILILAIFLATLIISLTLKLSLTPLGRLRNLAKQRHSGSFKAFNPGSITEFKQLSQEVANILTDLKNTEQQLRDNSYLLAQSHREQKALNSRNRKLLHQLFNLQEQERKHLAQELHDQLGQPLAVINTDAYLIKVDSTASDKIISFSESIQRNVNEMSDVVYRRISSLRPMPLNDLGLLEAVRHMPALDNLKQLNIGLEIDLPPTLPTLTEQQQIHLFRIIQESLTNIIKHSQADQAWLRIQLHQTDFQSPATLVLEIRDNGIGCSSSALEQSGGFGINGMIERVNSMKGSWSLTQNRAAGTCIRVRLLLTDSDNETISQVPSAPL